MSVTSDDLIAFAKKLIETDRNEVTCRSSTSRAYYAAYHLCQSYADLCPDNSHLKMGSHERLSDRYALHPTRTAKGISYILVSMKRFRNSADYDIDDPFDTSTPVNLIAQYDTLTEKLIEFKGENTPKSA